MQVALAGHGHDHQNVTENGGPAEREEEHGQRQIFGRHVHHVIVRSRHWPRRLVGAVIPTGVAVGTQQAPDVFIALLALHLLFNQNRNKNKNEKRFYFYWRRLLAFYSTNIVYHYKKRTISVRYEWNCATNWSLLELIIHQFRFWMNTFAVLSLKMIEFSLEIDIRLECLNL